MITERKSLGAVDSNVTRIQPTRAAKTGHKWLANRQTKPGQAGSSKLPQQCTYLQHLAQQQSQKQQENASKENQVQNNILNDSFKNLKQFETYHPSSYQNKNCLFRVPLQTLSFENARSSTSNLNLPNDNKDHKPAFFRPLLDSSDDHADSDVSLRSIPDEDVFESFLNKSQSGRKSRKSAPSVASTQKQSFHEIEIIEEYLPDILAYLKESEIKYKAKENYLYKQAEVTSQMRIKLIDWLIEVQDEYKLHNETLYLAVAFVDRFLSEMSVTRAKLQLLGTASMFLASKIEEIYPPDVNEFAYVTADTYTRTEVLLMERMILNVFGCALAMPTPHHFLTIFMEKSKMDESARSLAYYLCEIMFLDEKYLRYLPSVKAAAAVTLAILTVRFIRYCDLANGNLDSQESADSSMSVENGSQKTSFGISQSIFSSTIRDTMSGSIKEIYQCVLDLTNSHLQETNSFHFLREKYATTSRKEAARITPLLAESNKSVTCFLNWESVRKMWLK